MNETAASTLEVTLPEHRPCTRCDGTQHLLGSDHGFGKFRCDTCEMVVGFDFEAEPVEFLLHRGLPSRYSKQRWFGPQLAPQEQQLAGAVPSEPA
ncbi:MAG: hypothetical protein ACRDUY_05620 [Nitriliruptorales bacterium]